jgi:hypothetical protein
MLKLPIPLSQVGFYFNSPIREAASFAIYILCIFVTEVGKQAFFKSPQISNPQILRLILLSQIRKVLRCDSPQIANPQICMDNPQIANLQTYKLLIRTAQLCLKTVLKIVFVNLF